MSYQIIDMNAYVRRAHFDYFRSLPYPYVGTTVSVDVSAVLRYCHREKRSFYLAFLHAAALAADSVKELRQRIHGDGIIEYSECPTSHIELLEDLIMAAINDGYTKADKVYEEKMGKFGNMGGLGGLL